MVKGLYLVSATVGTDCFGLEGAIASFASLLDMLCLFAAQVFNVQAPFCGSAGCRLLVRTNQQKNALEI